MVEPDPRRIWTILEWVFTMYCIFTLWPFVLGWEGWIWEIQRYVALAGLIWIFTRRVKRYKSLTDQE